MDYRLLLWLLTTVMLDTLFIIALTLCWIVGFFVLAQHWGQSPNAIALVLRHLRRVGGRE